MDNKLSILNLSDNTDFSRNLSNFKILTEFMSHALVVSYQNKDNLSHIEISKIQENFDELIKILENPLRNYLNDLIATIAKN